MMKTTGKLLTIFLVISMLLAMISPVVALPADKTTQEKAQLLNTLKIISGTNGEFNLSNQVRRSEAATFIVNLLGKGAHVAANKAQYSVTSYTDVPSDQWYAPFIGFCRQNGYVIDSSTEYRPLDFVTEKEFLKLVLLAMEYRDNIDFTMDTVYDKAREIGLITLNEYINFMSEGISKIPTRGNVVDLLYAALSLSTRTGYKMAQKLIDENVVTRVEAMAYGLISDSKITSILSAENTGLDTIQVRFNENIDSVYEAKVYPKISASDYLACQAIIVTDDIVEIQTAPLEIGKVYVVELTNVKDTEGNIYGKMFAEFTGAEPKEIQSDFFRISKIEPVNERSVKVFFTHPLTINSEVCLYYSVLKDDTVIADGMNGEVKAGLLNSDRTGVLLSLNRSLTAGEIYTLRIDGNMMSGYAAKLNDGLGDSMKFIARENSTIPFRLTQIFTQNEKTLLLNFSKEINPFLAQQIYSFYLTDAKNNPMRINRTSLHSNGHALYLYLDDPLIQSNKYSLTINNINDVTKQEYITEEIFPFTAEFTSTAVFSLTGVNVINNQTFEVIFNMPLDEETASVLDYYSIYRSGSSSAMHPKKIRYDYKSNPNKIIVYLNDTNRLNEAQSYYELRISNGMLDCMGNNIPQNTKITFKGTNKAPNPVIISEVVPISTDAVKVSFTRDIAYDIANTVPSNYTLEYTYQNNSIRKVPYSVIIVDTETLILKFDSLNHDTSYKLRITEIKDFFDKIIKAQLYEFKF